MTIATQTPYEEESVYKSYARLRIMLDSLEELSLYYYSKGKTSEERIKFQEELEATLTPCVEKVRAMAMRGVSEGNPCPEGMELCNGFCVYNC